jgi:DNA-binding response OmpR family regulator
VILLDVMVPLVNGFDVFVELRQASFAPRILLMSAHAEPCLFTRAMELGAYACLRKPFDAAALRDAVRRALRIAPAAADTAKST